MTRRHGGDRRPLRHSQRMILSCIKPQRMLHAGTTGFNASREISTPCYTWPFLQNPHVNCIVLIGSQLEPMNEKFERNPTRTVSFTITGANTCLSRAQGL